MQSEFVAMSTNDDKYNDKQAENGRIKADPFDSPEIEKMLPDEFDTLYKTMPLTEETTCGWSFMRGGLWQK